MYAIHCAMKLSYCVTWLQLSCIASQEAMQLSRDVCNLSLDVTQLSRDVATVILHCFVWSNAVITWCVQIIVQCIKVIAQCMKFIVRCNPLLAQCGHHQLKQTAYHSWRPFSFKQVVHSAVYLQPEGCCSLCAFIFTQTQLIVAKA